MSGQLRLRALSATMVGLGVLGLTVSASAAPRPDHLVTSKAAAAKPAAATLPQTISADALPTVQINGVVWAQAVVGNTVYATGSFSYARPAGASATSTTKVVRTNLLAYDITTGVLNTSFVHSLNAQGLAIAASPDGSRIYVGGDFTQVDGVAHNRLVGFNTADGSVISTFAPNLNGRVHAVVVTASSVYAGGSFSTANGLARGKLAAFGLTGGVTPWLPSVNGVIQAMVMAPDNSRLIVGGAYTMLDGVTQIGLGAVEATTGGMEPWPANFPIQDGVSNSSVTSLHADGTNVYGTAYTYMNGGNFEGRFMLEPDTGAIIWMSNCHGDSYDSYELAGVLYSASHEHDCSDISSFSQNALTVPGALKLHAEAETVAATGVNQAPIFLGGGVDPTYSSFAGIASPTQLNWYPTFTIGTATGQNQAAWSIAGNSTYVSFGGEFPTVNGAAQQGLVRFAIRSVAPDKVGPSVPAAPTAASLSAGAVQVNWVATSDRDDSSLTYALYRDGGLTPITTTTATSAFYNTPALGYLDSGLLVGSSHTYTVRATDPSGNTVLSAASTPVIVGAATARSYDTTVLSDSPSNYWPMDETTGTRSYDYVGSSPLTMGGQVTPNAVGPFVPRDNSSADAFSGVLNPVGAKPDGTPPSSTSVSYSASSGTVTPQSTFTVEAWVNTTSTAGGLLVGEGLYRVGDSNSIDRVLYLDSSGKPHFGVTKDAVQTALAGNTAVNDGRWHLVVGTLGSSGASLYVDGVPAATSATMTDDEQWFGYWRIGGDNLIGWPTNPGTGFLAGSIADVAVYPTALAPTRVLAHFTAGLLGV